MKTLQSLNRRANNIILRLTYLLILIIIFIYPTQAKIGYDISVTVNDSNASSSWGWSHSTTALGFKSLSYCKGDGNTSRYIKVRGLAGIDLKETTYTKKGRIKEDKQLSIGSSVKWIAIDESVTNKSERYIAIINESIPSHLMSVNEITYRGEGIYKRDSYTNNEDKIMTNFQAKRFSESSIFLAKYQNAFIVADVRPAQVLEFAGENYSTQFQIASDSDKYSSFRFKSSDEFIDQNYAGSFKMVQRISKEHNFKRIEDQDFNILACCPLGYTALDYPLQAAWLCLCRSSLVDSTNEKSEWRDRK